ncbi:hypothetical protein NL108_008050, partial [Boleophthalmus pectinirostris]
QCTDSSVQTAVYRQQCTDSSVHCSASSAHKGECCHDAEAQQEEEHFEQLSSWRVEFVRQDFQKRDVDKCACSQPLQHSLHQSSRVQVRLHHPDAQGDAQGRHESKHTQVRCYPAR